jgi:general L-amino acid transport system permease protein
VRGLVFQVVLIAALVFGVWWIVGNTLENLQRSNISTGFDFLRGRAGFDISDRLIEYSSDSTYGRAIIIGLLNTLMVAACGIVTATIIGFVVGIGRLSKNWLIRKIATFYVELFRNIPPLLVIFFWYMGVLALLPGVRDSYVLPFGSYLNSRGFYFPAPVFAPGSWLILAGLFVGIALSWFVARRARARQMATGQQFPVLWTSLALILGFPLLGYALAGFPVTLDVPKAGNFNMSGGFNLKPEFLSLYLALSFYTASFIAEIVRAGILGVPKGQTEAYSALGLRSGLGLRLVVIPQALRIIIPPLTSQYLNLTKNSSLAVAIGYPDLYAIGGTILNQTGQAIEIVAIFGVIYLSISLLTSLFMNWFNAKMALKER